MQAGKMIETELYILTDTIAAVILAAAFLAGYAYDRKLDALLWWAGFYGLIAVSLATTVITPDTAHTWKQVTTWFTLFAATSVAACALSREGSMMRTPLPAIAASGGLFIVLVAYLLATDASNAVWFAIGPIPALVIMAISSWRVLVHPHLKPADWLTGTTLVAGLLLIFGRSLWFVHLETAFAAAPVSPPPPLWPVPTSIELLRYETSRQLPFSPEQPLILSSLTTLFLLSLAISSIMRAALSAIEGVRERSATDTLSGLLNRASFDERANALAGSTVSKGLCVVGFDIDHFKRVNDTAGHAAGDRVISALGAVICEALSDNQIAGRIGGEEFAVILPDSNLGTARLFAEAVRARFSACDFGPDIDWTVTVSGGVAARQDNEPLHALMARADQALYAAKRAGRNRIAMAAITPVPVEARLQQA